MSDIEARRLRLLRQDRALYDYIAAKERSAALDDAGNDVCAEPDGLAAANRIWRRSADAFQRAELLRESEVEFQPLKEAQ